MGRLTQEMDTLGREEGSSILKENINTPAPKVESSATSPGDTSRSDTEEDSSPKKKPRKLVEDELSAVGRINKKIWQTYFSAFGGLVFWIILSLVITVATLNPVFENGWLKQVFPLTYARQILTPCSLQNLVGCGRTEGNPSRFVVLLQDLCCGTYERPHNCQIPGFTRISLDFGHW